MLGRRLGLGHRLGFRLGHELGLGLGFGHGLGLGHGPGLRYWVKDEVGAPMD